ncbi:TonB-dependent receptor [Pontibacter diazotrophicus]|uniref:TonB-dependent receptor n=1 Tax=Pontibacter diazotrophicus TaxID=1400979 RepID=A0A3D8L1L8_9BACT|nr:TonB-dependent receptor [Pontibacter diazotrophicus]
MIFVFKIIHKMYCFNRRLSNSGKLLLIAVLLLICTRFSALAQSGQISGVIYDIHQKPLQGVSIFLPGLEKGALSNEEGAFSMQSVASGTHEVSFSLVGYEKKSQLVKVGPHQKKHLSVVLSENILNLQEFEVTSPALQETGTNRIDKLDLRLRPVNSAQDLLKNVPGLFIGQHAGGGKAEQLFLRGFDIDHGTDYAVFVDEMPVNMVSHAHGQGYADLHFVIPELIADASYNKGPYNTRMGNMAVAGNASFTTMTKPDRSFLKTEYGRFNSSRLLTVIDLIGEKKLFTSGFESAYVAAEHVYTDGYFESPQHYRRTNLFTKYSAVLNNRSFVSFSLSGFHSPWYASGQIPLREVTAGKLSRFGAIDDTEGGATSRYNVNASYTRDIGSDKSIRHNLYYTYNEFDLYSNFTFFLNDSVQGDQIRQREKRHMTGYKVVFTSTGSLLSKAALFEAGAGIRADFVHSGFDGSIRRRVLSTRSDAKIEEANYYSYVNETIKLSEQLTVNAGIRTDIFNYAVEDRAESSNNGQNRILRISPKLNFQYDASPNLQLYVRTGVGMHSNHAFVAVSRMPQNAIPKAVGADVGANFKIGQRAVANAALWSLHLQDELVFVGDELVYENSGASGRIGVDASLRYNIASGLWADLDVNYSRGRLLDEPEGQNYIALAPVLTSTGGLTYKSINSLNGTLRYRYMGKRAANDDNSMLTAPYFLVDAQLNYTRPKYEFGLSFLNLLNSEWQEVVYWSGSRLSHEAEPVNDFHFTPGTPLFIKAALTFFFRR